MSVNKAIYRQLCLQHADQIPLFLQDWWLDVVCAGKCWDVVIARKGDTVLGALPYLVGSKCGIRYVIQPQLTQFNGPWFNYDAVGLSLSDTGAKYRQRLYFEAEVVQELVTQLNKLRLSIFVQCFAPHVSNWAPFSHLGFSQTTRYTYRLCNISDTQAVWDAFSRKNRKKYILRLAPDYSIDTNISVEEFAALHRSFYTSRDGKDIVPYNIMTNLMKEALRRGKALLFALRNRQGVLHSALFVPFHAGVAYYLLSANSVDAPVKGISELIIWLALPYIAKHAHTFDFEGSMQPGIESFYRSFGAVQVPYHQVSRFANPMVEFLWHRFVAR